MLTVYLNTFILIGVDYVSEIFCMQKEGCLVSLIIGCGYESTVYPYMCVCMFMCTPQNMFVNTKDIVMMSILYVQVNS